MDDGDEDEFEEPEEEERVSWTDLALIAFVIALISDSVWVIIASTARAWFTDDPHRLAMIGGAGGLAMIGVGVTVAVTGRHD